MQFKMHKWESRREEIICKRNIAAKKKKKHFIITAILFIVFYDSVRIIQINYCYILKPFLSSPVITGKPKDLDFQRTGYKRDLIRNQHYSFT